MRAIRRRSVLGVVAVAAIAFTAACGGSDSDSGDQTVDEFIAAADEVCRDIDAQREALETPTSADEVQPFFEMALDLQRDQTEGLSALDPPPEVEESWNEAIGLLEDSQASLETAIDDIEGGADPAEVAQTAIQDVNSNNGRLDELAAEIGLMDCGDTEDSSTDTTTDDTLTTDGPAATDGPTAEGDVQQYLGDVGEASQALVSFGEILQGVTSPADLEAQVPEAQAALDDFDTAIAELDGYTLDDAQLEEQRAGLVETGPNVSDVLRRFTDAAAAGDLQAASMLIPEVTSALTEFQAAANVSSSP